MPDERLGPDPRKWVPKAEADRLRERAEAAEKTLALIQDGWKPLSVREADRLRAEAGQLKANYHKQLSAARAERDEARKKRDIAERASADRWDALQDTMRERSRLRAALREIEQRFAHLGSVGCRDVARAALADEGEK